MRVTTSLSREQYQTTSTPTATATANSNPPLPYKVWRCEGDFNGNVCNKWIVEHAVLVGGLRYVCPRCGHVNERIYRPTREGDRMQSQNSIIKPPPSRDYIRGEYEKALNLVKTVRSMQAQWEEDHRNRVAESDRLLAETQAIADNYLDLYPWLSEAEKQKP